MARSPLAKWNGRDVAKARAIVATWFETKSTDGKLPCGKCRQPVASTDKWVVGHIKSRHAYPELTWDVSNWWPEHQACSNKSSIDAIAERAIRDFSESRGLQAATALPVSPPEEMGEDLPAEPIQPALPIDLPYSTGQPITTREHLDWDVERLAKYEWLRPYLDVPDDAHPPLWMSPPAADAVGSYGPHVIEWAREQFKIELRWWQQLAIVRQLEHRADGSLCHSFVIESAPRRSGKSVRMRVVALWRLTDPLGLFDETQLVMHTGSDIPICREIQRGAWTWAVDRWGKQAVTKANGKECVETPEGDRWLVRSQDGVYGYDVTLGLVDEGWDVKPDTVSEGIEPATMERIEPQIHLTSTAHRRATSLMRTHISDALAMDDPEVLLVVWAAPAGSDPADPESWRAASPHWSESRRKLIARKYEKAKAGEVDPEADDPNPMAGFTAQYLNVWRLNERRVDKGTPVMTSETWAELQALAPETTPTAAAIESWFEAGVTLAVAWSRGATVVVDTTDHDTVGDAVAHLADLGYRGRIIVGASLADDPALVGRPIKKGEGRVLGAVQALEGLVRDGVWRHTGDEHLAGQILGIRTEPSTDGPRLVSKTRADAIKAAAWAVAAARPAARRRTKLVTAKVAS